MVELVQPPYYTRNLAKIRNLPVGSFVRLGPNPGDTIYTVTRKYHEVIDGTNVKEYFVDLQPSQNLGEYTLRVGHMDRDAERMTILARTPPA